MNASFRATLLLSVLACAACTREPCVLPTGHQCPPGTSCGACGQYGCGEAGTYDVLTVVCEARPACRSSADCQAGARCWLPAGCTGQEVGSCVSEWRHTPQRHDWCGCDGVTFSSVIADRPHAAYGKCAWWK